MGRWKCAFLLAVVGCGGSDLSGVWTGELLADDDVWGSVELDLVDERRGLGGTLVGDVGGEAVFDLRVEGSKSDSTFEVAGSGPDVRDDEVPWAFVLTGQHEDGELVGGFTCEVGDTGMPDDCLEGRDGTFQLVR